VLFGGLSGCPDPAETPIEPVTITITTDADPTADEPWWLAFQDGDGPWTVVSADEPLEVADPAGRYAVLAYCTDQEVIVYAATASSLPVAAVTCSDRDWGDAPLEFAVQGSDSLDGILGYNLGPGYGGAVQLPSTGPLPSHGAPGVWDLLMGHRPDGELLPTAIWLERDVVVPEEGTSVVLDLGAPQIPVELAQGSLASPTGMTWTGFQSWWATDGGQGTGYPLTWNDDQVQWPVPTAAVTVEDDLQFVAAEGRGQLPGEVDQHAVVAMLPVAPIDQLQFDVVLPDLASPVETPLVRAGYGCPEELRFDWSRVEDAVAYYARLDEPSPPRDWQILVTPARRDADGGFLLHGFEPLGTLPIDEIDHVDLRSYGSVRPLPGATLERSAAHELIRLVGTSNGVRYPLWPQIQAIHAGVMEEPIPHLLDGWNVSPEPPPSGSDCD
jgi:hypothetical protein